FVFSAYSYKFRHGVSRWLRMRERSAAISLSRWNDTRFDKGKDFLSARRTGPPAETCAFDGGCGAGKADDLGDIPAFHQTMRESPMEDIACRQRVHCIHLETGH